MSPPPGRFPMSPRRSRLARRLGLDRNPLRRRIDRVQAILGGLLIAAFLTAAPLLMAAAGHWASTAGLREEHAERAWRQVTAIVLRGSAARPDRAYAAWGIVWVSARWAAPDGQVRSVLIPVVPARGPKAASWCGWIARDSRPGRRCRAAGGGN